MRRGDWPTQRTSRMPNPPWPSPDNPMLAALLHDARRNVAAGMTTDMAMLQLATHCWFEGGIRATTVVSATRGLTPVHSRGRRVPFSSTSRLLAAASSALPGNRIATRTNNPPMPLRVPEALDVN